MKYTKFLFAAIIGLTACQTASAAETHRRFCGPSTELEKRLGLNQNNSTDSMVYAKFDAYSTWVEKNLTDNDITPKMGFGFRFRNLHHGFDFSLSGHLPSQFDTTIHLQSMSEPEKIEEISCKGVENYFAAQLTYLYYTRPLSHSTFYVGTGAGIDRSHTVLRDKERNKYIDEIGAISGLLLAGYEFALSETMKSFLQFQVSQPAYFYAKLDETSYGIKQTNEWLPTVAMSLGLGF